MYEAVTSYNGRTSYRPMSNYFYCRTRSQGLLCDAERDLLAIAKFLVATPSPLNGYAANRQAQVLLGWLKMTLASDQSNTCISTGDVSVVGSHNFSAPATTREVGGSAQAGALDARYWSWQLDCSPALNELPPLLLLLQRIKVVALRHVIFCGWSYNRWCCVSRKSHWKLSLTYWIDVHICATQRQRIL